MKPACALLAVAVIALVGCATEDEPAQPVPDVAGEPGDDATPGVLEDAGGADAGPGADADADGGTPGLLDAGADAVADGGAADIAVQDAADVGADAAAPADADAGDAQDVEDVEEDTGPLVFCDDPVPPAEALARPGASDDGHLLPGGRALTPVGVSVAVGGFPVDARIHPTLPVAFVTNTGKKHKSVQVVDLGTGEVLQDLGRTDSFHGMALTPDGGTLWLSGGRSELVERYAVGEDGLLTKTGEVAVDHYPAGLAFADDGRLWVGKFTGDAVARIDAETLTVDAEVAIPFGPYGVVAIPGRDELYVTGFADTSVAAVDVATGESTTFELGGNPLGLAVSGDGGRVWATVCDGDIVVAIDTATRELVGSAPVGEASLADEDGVPLPASSPADLLLDEAAGRLYLARSSDNAVSILDPSTLATTASLPVEWYPTGMALSPDGGTLLVCNAKGVSVGPTDTIGKDADDAMAGTVSIVSLPGLDLPALSAAVEANVRRPTTVFPFDCPDTFPVPPALGRKSPIKHVILVVRENKTYDVLLGDLETGDGDPELTLFGEGITPNLHALARRFTSHDNFYNDSENSMQGHLWLTASFVNEFVERVRLEGGSTFDTAPALEAGQPDYGTFFLHLIRHGVNFINFGEVVGSFGETDGKAVVQFTDLSYPGLFFNQAVKDEVKVKYVIDRLVNQGDFPPFVYLGIPNDHTYGKDPGYLSPESMINDNDTATGMLVDAISHSPYWDSTAIFILEDDPQTGLDHVEGHRSVLVVASPWAKRSHTSSVHTSYPSVFRTIELILNLPPMNRYDAAATPLWDAFTAVPDAEPYVAIPRTVEDVNNPMANDLATRWSMEMDWSGPDREPDLGAVLWTHVKGEPPAGSHLARAMAGLVPPVKRGADGEDDDGDDDKDAFDAAWEQAREYLKAHPEVIARHPPGTLPLALRDLEALRPAPVSGTRRSADPR